MTKPVRRRPSTWFVFLGCLLALHCSTQAMQSPYQIHRQSNLRLEQDEPSQPLVHVIVLSRGSGSSPDTPSNDDPPVNRSVTHDDPPDPNGIINSNTDDGARRLGIVALSFASATLMLVALALVWRKNLRAVSARQEEDAEDSVEEDPSMNPKADADGGDVSILRSVGTGLTAYTYKPRRRVVRFHLPGSSSPVDEAIIESAEGEENSAIDEQDFADDEQGGFDHLEQQDAMHINQQDVTQEQPLQKRTKITIHEEKQSVPEAPSPPPPPMPVPADVKKVLDKARVAPKPDVNDPESWVARIMQPWANSPLCCPDAWYNCNGKTSPASFLDQSTLATDSFESATPLVHISFPSSTQRDAHKDDADVAKVASEDAEIDEEAGVLGILGRNEVGRDDGVLAMEQVGERKRSREPLATIPTPPRGDGWYDGDHELVSETKSRSRSAWRSKAWVRVGDVTEDIDASPVEEEFDIESYPTVYTRRISGRLVEI